MDAVGWPNRYAKAECGATDEARVFMKLDALLRAHSYLKVERPPELWEGATEDVRFVPLLGEMIAAALSHGAELGDVTLNVSNVVIESRSELDLDPPSEPAPGEYVAVTVSGAADLGPDARWHREHMARAGLLARLHERLLVSGARFAYVRSMPPVGSVTVLFERADSARRPTRPFQP